WVGAWLLPQVRSRGCSPGPCLSGFWCSAFWRWASASAACRRWGSWRACWSRSSSRCWHWPAGSFLSGQDFRQMAAEELTPTSYIQHHLQNLTGQGGEGGAFWTLHVDTLATSVLMGLLMV